MGTRSRWSVIGVASMLMMLTADSDARRADIKVSAPESVGFSSQALRAYGEALADLVSQGRLAGVSTLVARHGKVVMYDAFGYRDHDTRRRCRKTLSSASRR